MRERWSGREVHFSVSSSCIAKTSMLANSAWTIKITVLIGLLIGSGAIGSAAWAQEDTRYGGRLSYAETEEALTLNPYQRTNPRGVTDRLYTLLYSALVSYDQERQKLLPGLATDWSTSSGESTRTVTFKLREGVKWHDGEPFGPKDVKHTYQYALKAGSNEDTKQKLEDIESVKTKSKSKSVIFKFKNKKANPVKRIFANLWIIPDHKFKDNLLPKGEKKLGEEPIGTGPYKFVTEKLSGNIELKAFEDYWGGVEPSGRPFIGQTKMKIYQDPVTMTQQAIGGNVDLIIETPPQQIARLEPRSQILLESYQSLSFDAFAYNTRKSILSQKKVRRAFTHALNRKEMLKTWYADKGTVIGGPVVPGSAYYNSDVEPLPYNPQKAKKLLREMGYEDRDGDGIRETSDGEKLSFRLVTLKEGAATSTTKQNVAETYVNSLNEVGVKVSLDNQVKAKYQENVLEKHNFDIAWVRWEFDPNYNFWGHFTTGGRRNIVGYSKPKVDTLFSRFKRASDPQLRRSNAKDAQKVISEDAPYTFLYTIRNYASLHRAVIKTRIDPYYFFSYYDNWYIDQQLR